MVFKIFSVFFFNIICITFLDVHMSIALGLYNLPVCCVEWVNSGEVQKAYHFPFIYDMLILSLYIFRAM